MKVVNTISALHDLVAVARKEKKSIGFVPTMGALHAGHISLVNQCLKENELCVVSVFVNPTQFNNATDLLKYPRTMDADIEMLEQAGCQILFAPETEEMYPEPDLRKFEFGLLEQVMEGEHRPGHFNGVAQIVSKLFTAVQPDKAYFGEKDFQQLAIVREMTRQLGFDVKIISCPIVREADGLAMSSRNMRLSPIERQKAVLISQILFKSRILKEEMTVSALKQWVIDAINSESVLKVEYFDIVDGNTLQSMFSWQESDYPVGCIAVFCGDIRLIDNISY